jgi:hypothetical protein
MAEPRLRLGEQLLAAGLITEEGLKEALAEQRVEGGYLADRLVELGLVDERALLRFMAEVSSSKYITVDTLSKANLPADALDKVPARHAELLCVLPLALEGRDGVLTLAVPELDAGLFEQVRLAAGVSRIQPILALRAAIRAGIRRFYYSDHYAFATLDHGAAKPVVRPAIRESIIARSSGPKPAPEAPENDAIALRREMERWKAVSELSRVLGREKSLKALLHRALAFSFDKLPAADDGVALLHDSRGRSANASTNSAVSAASLVPKAVRTRSGEAAEVVVSETLLKEVVSSGGLITTDAATDARFSMSESVMTSSLRSAMAVPLKVNDQLTGALVFGTRGEKGGVFTDADLMLATELGNEVAFALERNQNLRQEENENAQRDRFVKHFPPATAEQLVATPMPKLDVGEAFECTVLCARVLPTDRTLGSTPSRVLSALSAHSDQMADVIFSNAGMVLDCPGAHLLALFGVPQLRGDELGRAFRAATEMLERVRFMNELRIVEGKPSLELAVSLAHGPVVFGQVGERARAQFGALGVALDRAIQLASSADPGELVVDEPVAAVLAEQVGPGRGGPLPHSRVLSLEGT